MCVCISEQFLSKKPHFLPKCWCLKGFFHHGYRIIKRRARLIKFIWSNNSIYKCQFGGELKYIPVPEAETSFQPSALLKETASREGVDCRKLNIFSICADCFKNFLVNYWSDITVKKSITFMKFLHSLKNPYWKLIIFIVSSVIFKSSRDTILSVINPI